MWHFLAFLPARNQRFGLIYGFLIITVVKLKIHLVVGFAGDAIVHMVFFRGLPFGAQARHFFRLTHAHRHHGADFVIRLQRVLKTQVFLLHVV